MDFSATNAPRTMTAAQQSLSCCTALMIYAIVLAEEAGEFARSNILFVADREMDPTVYVTQKRQLPTSKLVILSTLSEIPRSSQKPNKCAMLE